MTSVDCDAQQAIGSYEWISDWSMHHLDSFSTEIRVEGL